MKSERRHDLKSNALARRLESFPDYWREYGNKVLLVVIIFLIAYLAVRYYNDKKARQTLDIANSLETIQTQLGQLDQVSMSYLSGESGSLAELRQKISSSATEAINTVLNSARDPQIIARAYVAQGDLDWKLASMPDAPGAATRPELKIQNRQTLLNDSKSAYSKVIEPPYNQNQLDVFSARMGLAAIAENQGQWDEAKFQYQAIADATSFPPTFKDLAKDRLKQLPEYEKPVLLTPPPEAATPSSSQPATFGPEAPPTSQPMTQPAGETSQATTMPSALSQPAASQPR
jgi:hypothetical protein